MVRGRNAKSSPSPLGSSNDLWSDSDDTVSEPEQHLYYAGTHSPKGRGGPKLIWRDSPDEFHEPTGPEEYKRIVRVIPVQDDHALGTEVGKGAIKWDLTRDHIVGLLKENDVIISSVDLVRFTWLNKRPDEAIDSSSDEEEDWEEDEEEDEDEDEAKRQAIHDYDRMPRIVPVEDGVRFVSNPTVWIGVLPDSLTATAASDVAKGIRDYLDGLDVGRIDIAFRESKFTFSAGPALFSPVDDGEALKPVIDKVSVTHSLSIQGLKTSMQGTLGPYFHANGNLYAITVRHNLFELDDNNAEYRYNNSKKRKAVMVMGDTDFAAYKASLRRYFDTLQDAAQSLEKRVETYKRKVEEDSDPGRSKVLLHENEVELSKTKRHMEELQDHFSTIRDKWSDRKNRIIGHVVWAPPIGTGQDPDGFSCDLCVVQLSKKKFRNLMGNVLDLGTKYHQFQLLDLIYERDNVPSEFKFPSEGRLELRDMLSVDQIKAPASTKGLNGGEPIRRVLKEGSTTGLTVGGLGKYMSFVRKYFPTGHQESVELPVFNHEAASDAFSNGGDSGSLIVDPLGRFVSLLIGGSKSGAGGSDITYSTPFAYVWELVCKEFPGANLSFNGLKASANVAV